MGTQLKENVQQGIEAGLTQARASDREAMMKELSSTRNELEKRLRDEIEAGLGRAHAEMKRSMQDAFSRREEELKKAVEARDLERDNNARQYREELERNAAEKVEHLTEKIRRQELEFETYKVVITTQFVFCS